MCFPGFGLVFGILFFLETTVFKNSQLPVELNVLGKWVDLFPAPLFSMTVFPLSRNLNRYSEKKKYIFVSLFSPYQLKQITSNDTLGGTIETQTQLLTTWATGSWFKPLGVVMELRAEWRGLGRWLLLSSQGGLVVFVFALWGGGVPFSSGVECASFSQLHWGW